MSALRARWTIPAVFAASFAFIWWLCGIRLVLTNDEGIYLSHAARIAGGEVLYRDLFGFTGPASYWLLALAFKVFGVSLASAHLILAAQIATLTTLIFYVARELADTASGIVGAVVFLFLNVADAAMMTNNHRWDSGTYAVCGVVAIWRGHPFLGGMLLALAVWATPTFAITALAAVGGTLLLKQSPWRVIAGGAVGAAGGVLALALNGSLAHYVQNLFWVKDKYSDVNRMAYGSIIGGYPALFEGASGGLEWVIRGLIVVGLTLPAWLPVLCGLLLIKNRGPARIFFFVCGLSMISAASPRFDIGHLVFAAPLFYPIAASFLPKARWAVVPIGALTLLFIFSAIMQRMATEKITTPFGEVRVDANSAEMVRWLTAEIKPGEQIFVYPYLPVAYVLTRGRNVSRFCYLQPGLFTVADERLAVSDMMRTPPAKVLYMDIPPAELSRIWPASDPNQLKLNHVHEFVLSNFEPAARFKNLQIYTPRTSAAAR